MKTYQEIKNQDPKLFECFFAFSKKQMKEGIEKNNLQDKKLYSYAGGLYGTKEGIHKLFSDYENQDKEVAETCDPQDVYRYEFDNHECIYTCDDSEALAIVERIFGERSNEVKRKFAYAKI